MYSSVLLIIAAFASTTLASPVAAAAATSTTTAVPSFTSSAHKGPNAPFDVELIYRNEANTECNGANYKVATIRTANAQDPIQGCVTFDNPAKTFQVGARPQSQQIGFDEQAIGCEIGFYTSTDCSDGTNYENDIGSIPSAPEGTAAMTTYGTCYKAPVLARSAAILCGP